MTRFGDDLPGFDEPIKRKPEYVNGPIRRWLPFLILPGILICVVVGLLMSSMRSGPAYVYLVNGLGQRYEVLINGKSYTVPTRRTDPVPVPYGSVTVECPASGRGPDLPDAHLKIEASFWERIFNHKTYVINPDRLAIVVRESAFYSETPNVGPEGDYTLHAGQAMYVLDDLDFRMRQLPDEIQLASSNGEWRSTCYLIHALSLVDRMQTLMDHLDQQAFHEYMARAVRLMPEDELASPLAKAFLESDEYERFSEEMLARRPVMMEWHRAYQTEQDIHGSPKELAEAYRDKFQAEPDNPDLAYLYVRTIQDPARARREIGELLAQHPDHPYLHLSMSFHDRMRGRFVSALEHARIAAEQNPDSLMFAMVQYDMALACEAFIDLIVTCEKSRRGNEADLDLTRELVWLRTLDGDAKAAERVMARYPGELRKVGVDSMTISLVMQDLRLSQALGNHDVVAYRQLVRQTEDEAWRFERAVMSYEWEAALEAVEQGDVSDDVETRLFLYLVMRDSGAEALAQKQLERAIFMLRESGSDERLLADWLSGDVTLPTDVDQLIMVSNRLDVVYAALAETHPGQARRLRQWSRQHMYIHDFIHVVLDSIL